MKKFALVGALAALTIASTACGGGDDTLSQGDYIDQLEDICNRADRDLRDIEDPVEVSEFVDASDEAISITNDALDEVKELTPPEDLQRDHDDFVAGLEDLVAGFEDLRDAAEDDDEDALNEAGEKLTDASTDVDDAAEALEADDCVGVGEEEEAIDDTDDPTDTTIEESTDTTIEESTDTTGPDEPTETTVDETIPRVTVPPVDMTMPAETEPPVVTGSDIGTFDFDNLTTPAGYTWQNIDAASLADIQTSFAETYENQIALIGGADVTDEVNGIEFSVFAFFWNEADIVASGTGQEFLDVFTGSADASTETVSTSGFPITTWIDSDGAEGVGAIDADVSVILYGDSGSTQALVDFFDAFIAAQG